jgi:hypothetical protein
VCAWDGCGKSFEHCGCEPGRCYCSEECSAAARAVGAKEARATYNARDTEEGRAAHAAEEAERRERHAREKQSPGEQGVPAPDDQGLGSVPTPLEAGVRSAVIARTPGVLEPAGSAPAPAVLTVVGRQGSPGAAEQDRATVGVGDQRCIPQLDGLQRCALTALCAVAEEKDASSLPVVRSSSARAEHELVEWILVVEPEEVPAARGRVGAVASCPFCGRRGRIRQVASTDEWRRWLRRGLDPPT